MAGSESPRVVRERRFPAVQLEFGLKLPRTICRLSSPAFPRSGRPESSWPARKWNVTGGRAGVAVPSSQVAVRATEPPDPLSTGIVRGPAAEAADRHGYLSVIS